MKSDRFLIVPDLQVPFHHGSGFQFLKNLQTEYKIPKSGVLCVGDEIDQCYASGFDLDPDADRTANQEIQDSIDALKELQSMFPVMRIATSNHMIRWGKKASRAGIPSRVIRSMRDLYELPDTWYWQDRWTIDASHARFILTHGMEYGGGNPLWAGLQYERLSTAFGHHHSCAGVQYLKKLGDDRPQWSACGGSLIDVTKYAFKYGRFSKKQPILGACVVIDGGLRAEFVPPT